MLQEFLIVAMAMHSGILVLSTALIQRITYPFYEKIDNVSLSTTKVL
jgi:hypothetical protein